MEQNNIKAEILEKNTLQDIALVEHSFFSKSSVRFCLPLCFYHGTTLIFTSPSPTLVSCYLRGQVSSGAFSSTCRVFIKDFFPIPFFHRTLYISFIKSNLSFQSYDIYAPSIVVEGSDPSYHE